jgi:hypothetical protein
MHFWGDAVQYAAEQWKTVLEAPLPSQRVHGQYNHGKIEKFVR